MQNPTAQAITGLLLDWSKGDKAALAQLLPVVYQELRKLAQIYLGKEHPGHTLQPTALIHEAYLRLLQQHVEHWDSRAHFYGVAAHLMRQILVEHARARQAEKRGGGVTKFSLDEALDYAPERAAELIALDDALTALAAQDARKCRVIELRHFAGLSIAETALVLSVSEATVERDQRMAQAWLYHELNRAG